MNWRRFEKLPNAAWYTPLFAPIGSSAPTCAMTTPISPAGTCTHGCFWTAKIGQSLMRRPGMSSSAWKPGLVVEGDRVVLGQLAEREALVDQPDLASDR